MIVKSDDGRFPFGLGRDNSEAVVWRSPLKKKSLPKKQIPTQSSSMTAQEHLAGRGTRLSGVIRSGNAWKCQWGMGTRVATKWNQWDDR